eukprot:scaffold4243_cov112-Isochrysis_galbana.AAC.2
MLLGSTARSRQQHPPKARSSAQARAALAAAGRRPRDHSHIAQRMPSYRQAGQPQHKPSAPKCELPHATAATTPHAGWP